MVHRTTCVLSGTPESNSKDILEEWVISVLAEIDVFVEHHDVKASHTFGKPNKQKTPEKRKSGSTMGFVMIVLWKESEKRIRQKWEDFP